MHFNQGWVAQFCCSWLSLGQATRISHGRNSHWDKALKKEEKEKEEEDFKQTWQVSEVVYEKQRLAVYLQQWIACRAERQDGVLALFLMDWLAHRWDVHC